MRHYRKISIIENTKRIRELYSFKLLVLEYFNKTNYDRFIDKRNDTADSIIIRSEINENIVRIYRIMEATDADPIIVRYPPPAIGGPIIPVNIITELFNLSGFGIEIQRVFDSIGISIGVYKDDLVSSIVRTFNPMYWLSELLFFFAVLPFRALTSIGISQANEWEQSVFGKTWKAVVYIIQIIGVVYGILRSTGLLKTIIDYAKGLRII